MRVIMTGGGTGGHVYPAIAIADEIKKRKKDAKILFIGSKTGLERELVPANGYDIELIPSDGFNRKNLLKNIDVMKTLRKGNKRSREIIREFNPDIVIGTGGYASAPVVRTAQKMKIPTFIHEQNAVPGMTNKMLERKVNKVFLGFEAASEHFSHKEKQVLSGNPVRMDFLNISRAEAREELGFKDKDFVLLAFGGSQGAGRINKAMMNVIKTFNGVRDFKICLATGSYYYEAITEEFQSTGVELDKNIIIMEYIHDMAKYLSASDIIVSRSGALTVAEATACGKAAIYIPSPLVTRNHQYFNAMSVAEKGGALVIEEKDLDNDKLVDEILKLKNNPQLLRAISQKSAECAHLKAAEIICDNIIDEAIW